MNFPFICSSIPAVHAHGSLFYIQLDLFEVITPKGLWSLCDLGNCYGISVSQMTNDIYRYSSSQSVIYSFLTYCRICSKNIVHCSLRFLHKTRCSVSLYLLLWMNLMFYVYVIDSNSQLITLRLLPTHHPLIIR